MRQQGRTWCRNCGIAHDVDGGCGVCKPGKSPTNIHGVRQPRQRLVCVIPLSGYVPEHGWRAAFVKEGEPGYHLTGEWPCPPGGIMPWFWGHDLKEAQLTAHQQNERAGIDAKTAAIIIAHSMIGKTPRVEVCSVCDGPIDEDGECRCDSGEG